jgi:ankyrin repeat protein
MPRIDPRDNGLYYDEDDMKQTLFHIAAINGARAAIKICLSVIKCSCSRCTAHVIAHAPDCRMVTRLLTSVDKEGYSPLDYAITKSKTLAVSNTLGLLGITGKEEIRKLLRKTITSGSGNNADIMCELLTVMSAGTEKEYRTDVFE